MLLVHFKPALDEEGRLLIYHDEYSTVCFAAVDNDCSSICFPILIYASYFIITFFVIATVILVIAIVIFAIAIA